MVVFGRGDDEDQFTVSSRHVIYRLKTPIEDTLQYLKFFTTLIPSNSRKTGEFLRYILEAMTEVNVYTRCGWFYSEPSLRRPISRWHRNEPWPRYFSVAIVFARQQWNLRRQRRNFTRSFFLHHGHPKSCGKITEVGCEVKMNIPSLSVLSREKTVWSGLDR